MCNSVIILSDSEIKFNMAMMLSWLQSKGEKLKFGCFHDVDFGFDKLGAIKELLSIYMSREGGSLVARENSDHFYYSIVFLGG